MSLLASVVVSTAMLGNVQFDGDAQGRAVLAWDGWRGERYAVRTVDVVDGRPAGRQLQLFRARSSADLALADVDVAPDGGAVLCFKERRGTKRWRVRVSRRAPGGAWSKPVKIDAPPKWVDELTCAIGDGGHVALAWEATLNGRIVTASIASDGTVTKPEVLAPMSIDGPQVGVAPDGRETATYTVGRRNRTVWIAQRPAGGRWSARAVAPGMLTRFAIDGAGRAAVGWTRVVAETGEVGLASGPAFAPATLATEPRGSLLDVAAGPRGDVLVGWSVNSWAWSYGDPALRIALQRPGEPFGSPVTLAGSDVIGLALAADGTGAAAVNAGDPDHPQPVLRRLGADGSWMPPEPLPTIYMQFAAAPGGRVSAAWTIGHEELAVGIFG